MAATRQEIVININSKSGDMSADVACGPGGAICESMLADVLGHIQPTKKEKRPEYFQKRVTVQTQPNKR